MKINREKVEAFSRLNPIVNFIFFALVIACTCLFIHPVLLALSFFCALSYSVFLKGFRKLLQESKLLIPTMILTMLINPAFSHSGVTILTYLPSGNPLTLESILYGVYTGIMLITVILWFGCFNLIMTTDKFVYIFGRITPALSLLLSMSLRFIPRFTAQLKEITVAQRSIGNNISSGKLLTRMKHLIRILSILLTWALENAVETSDSMKSRGYGLRKRSSFAIFRFTVSDKISLCFISLIFLITFVYAITGQFYFTYYPSIQSAPFSLTNLLGWICYGLLLSFPICLNIKEGKQWKMVN